MVLEHTWWSVQSNVSRFDMQRKSMRWLMVSLCCFMKVKTSWLLQFFKVREVWQYNLSYWMVGIQTCWLLQFQVACYYSFACHCITITDAWLRRIASKWRKLNWDQITIIVESSTGKGNDLGKYNKPSE